MSEYLFQPGSYALPIGAVASEEFATEEIEKATEPVALDPAVEAENTFAFLRRCILNRRQELEASGMARVPAHDRAKREVMAEHGELRAAAVRCANLDRPPGHAQSRPDLRL